jgi:CRISPR-associated protein Csx10
MSAPSSFTLVFEMLSDWHIGLGAGRHGAVDSTIRRDWEGFPYIPGKTCVGILRDACEVVAEALGSDWPKVVDVLFGSQPALSQDRGELNSPIPAALQVSSARYPERIRRVLKGKPALLGALTFLKPGVQINRDTGTAEEDFLRYEEMARRGDKLYAQAHLDLSSYPEDVQNKAFALLLAGCRFAERLGGKRRRGTGKCSVSVDGASLSEWKEHLKGECSVSYVTNRPQSLSCSGSGSPKQESYALHIKVETPVVIMSRVVGNVVETLDFIPGAFLLPIVGRRIGQDTLARAIAANQVRVTHAYPVVRGTRGLPVPFCFFQEKMNPEKIHNRLWSKEPAPQIKACRDSYITAEDGKVFFSKPKRMLVTHNVVDDSLQRPQEEGVYSLQSIEPGAEFTAYLMLDGCPTDGLEGDWGQWRIGTAKHSEYGLVTIRAKKIDDVLSAEQQLVNPVGRGANASDGEPDASGGGQCAGCGEGTDELLVVWLLSDALLRDSKLRLMPSVNTLKNELESKLGVALELRQEAGLENSISRQRRIESWQTQWGLPRHTLLGLQAGTVAVFKVKDGTLNSDKLRELERAGIGERTAEGYGRIAFNHPFLSRDRKEYRMESGGDERQSARADDTSEWASLPDEDKAWVRRIQITALKSHIGSVILAKSVDRNWRQDVLGISGDKPSNSQLNALRVLVLRLSDDASNIDQWRQSVNSWRESLSRSTKKDSWPEDAIRKLDSMFGTQDGAGDTNKPVWALIDQDIQWDDFCVSSNRDEEIQELRRSLWPFALKSLVDAVVRAEVRSRSGGEENAQEDQKALRNARHA